MKIGARGGARCGANTEVGIMIMRLWDSALIKILALISLIALLSVAQAVIQGH